LAEVFTISNDAVIKIVVVKCMGWVPRWEEDAVDLKYWQATSQCLGRIR